jgi:hypothetical protein
MKSLWRPLAFNDRIIDAQDSWVGRFRRQGV